MDKSDYIFREEQLLNELDKFKDYFNNIIQQRTKTINMIIKLQSVIREPVLMLKCKDVSTWATEFGKIKNICKYGCELLLVCYYI